jgi:NitT/TauT family transport system permease protein
MIIPIDLTSSVPDDSVAPRRFSRALLWLAKYQRFWNVVYVHRDTHNVPTEIPVTTLVREVQTMSSSSTTGPDQVTASATRWRRVTQSARHARRLASPHGPRVPGRNEDTGVATWHRPPRSSLVWITGLVAAAGWLATAAITGLLPDTDDFERTNMLAQAMAWLGVALALLALGATLLRRPVADRIRNVGPWLITLAALFALWELITAKFALLPRPFFASPQAVLEVFTDDAPRLGDSVWNSVCLLVGGYGIGAILGFVAGVAMGWSRAISYWAHPVLRLVGPLPATAWLPLAFFAFPSSHSASTFLIALATGFPVTVLTWSGVAGVNKAYYDVARTMGATTRFLVLRVAIPAAMPSVFVGLFMGLGASFSVLVVAEMMGVKSGLGWYLQWAQGWAAYANMYAALLVMALMCTGLITVLFRLRDRLLYWQKGLVQW